MRLKLYFNLENEIIPIQYRRCVLSFIKKSLQQYNQEYYERLYHPNNNTIKPFTFAVFFKEPQFTKEEIIIKDKKMEINFSIEDYEIGIILYNSFNNAKSKTFSINKNSWTLQNISMVMEKEILTDTVTIKFMSALVARRRENEKDYYYSFADKEFSETVKINIKEQLKITDLPEEIVDTFEIKAIDAKKTVIKFYEQQIESSIGTFQITGDRKLLNYLYKAGVGSRHSAGFGMFQIV